MALVPVSLVKSLANKYLYDSSATKSVTYKTISKVFSPTTNEVTETPTSVSTRALPIKYTEYEVANSGGVIQQGDKRFIIREKDLSDGSVTPKIGDRIVMGSEDWEVLDFENIEVGEQGIMWEFHCRL